MLSSCLCLLRADPTSHYHATSKAPISNLLDSRKSAATSPPAKTKNYNPLIDCWGLPWRRAFSFPTHFRRIMAASSEYAKLVFSTSRTEARNLARCRMRDERELVGGADGGIARYPAARKTRGYRPSGPRTMLCRGG